MLFFFPPFSFLGTNRPTLVIGMLSATMLARTALSRGITAQHLCKNVTLYMNELTATDSGSPRQTIKPLLLMLPWLGSRPQAVDKYCEIYFRTGFDVLVVESEIKDFLWPRWGLDRGKILLDLLLSDRFMSRPLLVHAFSIGGYTFSQLLIHMSHDQQKYQEITKRIKGQVYDSLVIGSLEQMTTGIGKTVFPRFETLIKQISLLYFTIFKTQTVDYFNSAIDVFWNTPVKAPALMFFCENDVMSHSQTMEKLIDHWKMHGMEVSAKKWKDSTHAGHLRRYPQEYLTALNTFLNSLQIYPLEAKM